MRAVFVLLLAIVAVAFFAPLVSAQPPPRNASMIAFFNDSSCTEHLFNEVIPFPSSTKCVPEHYRHHNESVTFQCTTVNNQTSLSLNFYNNTESCDNTAIVTYASSAPAHTCAPITLTAPGTTVNVYAHIRCEDAAEDSSSRLGAALSAVRAIAPKQEKQESVVSRLAKQARSRFAAKHA